MLNTHRVSTDEPAWADFCASALSSGESTSGTPCRPGREKEGGGSSYKKAAFVSSPIPAEVTKEKNINLVTL